MKNCRIFIAMILAAASVCFADPLPAPIVTTFTQHDLWRAAVSYEKRSMSDVYDKFGRRNPKWDADAKLFLDKMALHRNTFQFSEYYHPDEDLSKATLLRLANAPALAECDDPLVMYCKSLVLMYANDYGNSADLLKKSLPGILESQYPPFQKYLVIHRYFRLNEKNRNKDEASKLAARLYEEWANDLAEAIREPLDRRIKIREVIKVFDDVTAKNREKMLVQLDAAPAADMWIRHMVRGKNELCLAWEARGKGFANTVTEEGWKEFKVHLKKARESFEAAYRLEPAYPESAGAMISVAMGLNDPTCKTLEWFSRATSAQIDYMPAWKAYEWSLYPRWGGSHDKMYALGQLARLSARYDTETPAFLLDVLRDIKRDKVFSGARFDMTENIWPNIKAVFDGYDKNPPIKRDINKWHTRQLGIAWWCQEYENCLTILNSLQGKADANTLATFGPSADEIRIESEAMVSEKAGRLRRARKQELVEEFFQAKQAYRKITESVPKDHPAWSFAHRHGYYSEVQHALTTTEVVRVPLKQGEELIFWRNGDKSQWKQDEEGLIFTTSGNGHAQIENGCPLPKNLRIKLEWNYSSPSPMSPAFNVYFSNVGPKYGTYFGLSAYPFRNMMFVGSGQSRWMLKGSQINNASLQPDTWHSCTIERENGKFTLIHDGQTVVDHVEDNWINTGTPVLILNTVTSPQGGTVRIRNLTIESLKGDEGSNNNEESE